MCPTSPYLPLDFLPGLLTDGPHAGSNPMSVGLPTCSTIMYWLAADSPGTLSRCAEKGYTSAASMLLPLQTARLV